MKRNLLTRLAIHGAIGLLAEPAFADTSSQTITYAQPGEWVIAAPAADDAPVSANIPAQFAYLDNQVRELADGTEEVYTAYRVRLLKPEGLPAGNITVTWQPDQGQAIVHYVRLIRAGQTTDVLATTKFTVVQREGQLESSMLTGQRAANLQVPDVQVGDELAIAVTIRRRDKAFGGHVANMMQLPTLGTSGTYRFRLIWPAGRDLTLRSTSDLTLPVTSNSGAGHTFEITLRNPVGIVPTEGAPTRFNLRRMIEYSDYGSWADLSRQWAPLYEHAQAIAANSPLQTEIATIAAQTTSATERAQAALQLVEDRIRYVYVGLNGGNYTPASADETWQRRFGDCKGKAVLLVALLRTLGIAAEPALVNSHGGDGLDRLLPGQQWFDHVIVRAVIAGTTVWLDGTRLGDRYLGNLPTPFRWALPISSAGSDLEKIAPRDTGSPSLIGIVAIDATAGFDQDAGIAAQNIVAGDEAFAMRNQLAALSEADADRGLKSYWHQQIDWATPDKVSWHYDERRMAITLGLIGRGNPGWTGDASQGHSLSLPGAGFFKPDPMRRPLDQDQTAPWAVEFPRFRCWATTVRLPKASGKFTWSLYAEAMNRQLGGRTYWRASGMRDNVVRTVMSYRSYEAEASPQEAVVVNRAIPGFNNNMSSIAEEPPGSVVTSAGTLPFGDGVDWVNAPTPCGPKSP